ncbi:hypothetical protein, partial [Spirosoma sp.]|uniref:hypothetical protein n=1 Tax=Spirosoma sp. TaxID=1899569 RepID=UPI003B3B03D3
STKPGVRIAQEFGASLGEVPTFDEVDSTGLPIGWTSQNMGNNERYVTGTGTDVDPKKLVIIGGGDEKINGATPSVYCRIDYPAGSLENKDGVFMTRRIKAQFRLSEVRAAKVWVVIQRDDEPYLLSNGQWIRFSKLKKADSVATLFYNIYTVDGVQKTKPGWADLNLELPAIDRVYSIIIYLGRAELLDQPNPNIPPKVEYARVRMETSQEGLSLNGTQQTIVRPGESVKDTTLTIQLGDVPAVAQPERRVGTLYHISGVPTRLWFKANANVSAPGNGIAGGMTLLSTIAQHEAKQAMFPAKQIEGDLLGDLPYGPLTMLTTDDMADLGKAFLTRWEWIVDECSHSISAERLMADQTGLPQTVKEWDTPDGLLPMAEGEDGSPVSPAEKKNFREDDQLLKRLIALGVVTPNLKAIPSQNGFTPLDGRGKLTANVYVGGVLKGTIASRLRKLALTLDDLLK